MIERARNRHGARALDDEFVRVLREHDELLRRGVGATQVATGQDTPAQAEALGCLSLLERVWPRNAGRSPPMRLGKFELERVVGQGGFGIVYLARDTKLCRTVALKVPRLHTLSNGPLLKRFEREARAAATLDHPNIVSVYEAGDEAGLCYIASAFCPGPNLAQWLKEQTAPLPADQAAQIVAAVADAVAYSHARGVLHRDIKPSNVMLVPVTDQTGASAGRFGATQSLPFVPRLADFGLAKIRTATMAAGPAADDSAGTALLGTPAYMAPEQLVHDAESNGIQADIYSLGAVLFELLSGRPPFAGANVADVLTHVQTSEPVPIQRLRRDVPCDLDTICLKCLEKKAGRRYATADELRDDLNRFLRREPIRARPPGLWDTSVKWVRRNPAGASLLGTLSVAIVSVLLLQLIHAHKLQSVNDELGKSNSQLHSSLAESGRLEEDQRRRTRQLAENSYGTALGIASLSLHNREPRTARELLGNSIPDTSDDVDIRGIEWDYLWTQANGPKPAHEFSHGGAPLLAAAVSPDGRLGATGDEGGSVRIWDLQTGVLRAALKSNRVRVVALQFSDDGQFLAAGGSFDRINVWRTDTCKLVKAMQTASGTTESLDFSPDNERLVSGGRDGRVRVWNWRVARIERQIEISPGEKSVVYLVRFSPDGNSVHVASEHGRTFLWDLTQPTADESVRHPDETNLLGSDVSADGRMLVTAGYSGPDRITRISDGRTVQLALKGTVYSSSICRYGRFACLGRGDGEISLLEIGSDLSWVQHRHWFGHTASVQGAGFSADGRYLLTASDDGTARLWDVTTIPQIGETLIYPSDASVMGCHQPTFSPDGRLLCWLVSASDEWKVIVYDLEAHAIVRVISSAGARFHNPHFSSDSRRVLIHAETKDSHNLFSWHTEGNDEPVVELPDIAFAVPYRYGGEKMLVSGGASGSRWVRIWNQQTRQYEQTLLTDLNYVHSIDTSRDGRLVLVADSKSPARLVDLQSGSVRAFGRPPHDLVTGARLYPSGDRLAVFDGDRLGSIFDISTGDERRFVPVQPTGHYFTYEFSPGGQLLAVVGSNLEELGHQLTLVKADSDQLLYSCRSYGKVINGVAWSPDGTTIAATTGVFTGLERPALILWHLSDAAKSIR